MNFMVDAEETTVATLSIAGEAEVEGKVALGVEQGGQGVACPTQAYLDLWDTEIAPRF